MKEKCELPRRRQVRLKGYDYSQSGEYFVTICSEKRICQFGKIIGIEMVLNNAGEMVKQIWKSLPKRFPCVRLDSYQIMPNLIHAIIAINQPNVGTPLVGVRNKASLSDIVGAFKSITTNLYIFGVQQYNWPRFPGKLWQARFHDHIIRNDKELDRIREYIQHNPMQWVFDRENPHNNDYKETHRPF